MPQHRPQPPEDERKKSVFEGEEERLSRQLGELSTIIATPKEMEVMKRESRLGKLKTEALLEVKERPEDFNEVKEVLAGADRLTSELYDLLYVGAETLEEKQAVLKDLKAVLELKEADVKKKDPFDPLKSGANNSHIAHFEDRDRKFTGIYKPSSGEANRPGCKGLLPGIEAGTYYGRELLTFMMDRAVGSKFVSPTVLRWEKEGVGSVQEWVKDAPSLLEAADLAGREIKGEKIDYLEEFKKLGVSEEEIVEAAAEHYVTAQADGRPANIGVKEGHLVLFDNGGIYTPGFKYLERGETRTFEAGITRSVLLEAAKNIPPEVQERVLKNKYKDLLEAPQRQEVLRKAFNLVLGDGGGEAWNIFMARVGELAETGRLPADYDIENAKYTLAVGMGLESEGKVEMAEIKIEEERAAA